MSELVELSGLSDRSGLRGVVASAPGKLILLGEYAVLEEAPCLVMAMQPRARVCLDMDAALDAGAAAAGVRLRQRAGSVGETVVESLAAAQVPLLQAALEQLGHMGLAVPAAVAALELDTAGHFAGADKLGLGSSAALTVALLAALAPQAVAGEDFLAHCIDCHRRFQGGRGSGADVAASVCGGVISFQGGAGQGGAGPTAAPYRLPDGLLLDFCWSGRGASTRVFLDRLADWRGREPQAFGDLFAGLRELMGRALQVVDAGAFLAVADEYDSALHALSEASGMGFYSEVHVAMRDIAHEHGCVYKPSGAGGGDFGMLLTDDPHRLTSAVAALDRAGFRGRLVQPASRGVQVQGRPIDG